jgi:hypothetical protein
MTGNFYLHCTVNERDTGARCGLFLRPAGKGSDELVDTW